MSGTDAAAENFLRRIAQLPINEAAAGISFTGHCAVSSVVEHHLDTVGVTGSNPVSRTTVSRCYPMV